MLAVIKKNMKKYTLFSLIIIFQSCITLELGESGYRSLDNFKKLHIHPFESALSEQSCLTENCRTIFEINSNNILELTKKSGLHMGSYMTALLLK